MKIEINKKKRKFKFKKPEEINIDFSSINKLIGNKILLEYIFQATKKEIYGEKS